MRSALLHLFPKREPLYVLINRMSDQELGTAGDCHSNATRRSKVLGSKFERFP
jgi:hypothetical protein